MNNVFIIGCKGIPARYGGFETFTDNLISRKKSKSIQYYVACMSENKNDQESFVYHDAVCKKVYVPDIGAAKAILYDLKSMEWALKTIKERKLQSGYVYILGCTVGPLVKLFANKFRNVNFKVYVNPDGHEWKRDKWSYPVKQYFKLAEKEMIKTADLTICDSVSIEEYVNKIYSNYNPATTYIAYGSDLAKSRLQHSDYKVKNFFEKFSIREGNYYLVVGRFVPENNYKTIIREFMNSNTNRDLVIVTNYQENKFFDKLRQDTKFEDDNRVKFVGTVYDSELLKYLRENAFAYIHGHSVGGTNPSLLEAMGSTKLNLLYNIGFNHEVAQEAALYWNKRNGNLTGLINKVDKMSEIDRNEFHKLGQEEISKRFSWNKIVLDYEKLFSRESN